MWYMRPVTVTIDVPQGREEVFDFLDVMANHEPFTNHMLKDWQYSGPDRGIGSKARVNAVFASRKDPVEIEVVAAERPGTIVERNLSAGGRRIGNGTYRLHENPGGGTRIEFEYSWQQPLRSDRLAAPLIRAMLRRGNQQAMRRLAELLAARAGAAQPAAPA